jgi:hypothetical protein
MPRRTKKIYGKKAVPKRRFYTKRYMGGDYSDNIKGLMHDVAGTFSEDIAKQTTEMIENRLNSDFGEKVAEKTADKVIASMAQVFQDAAAKIAEKNPTDAPLMSSSLGQVDESAPVSSEMESEPASETEDSSIYNPPTVDETETPTEPQPAETPAEAPMETPAEAPMETSAETPMENPAEAPVEPQSETPVEPQSETPVEPPAAEQGAESGPPREEMAEPAQTGTGDANPESKEEPMKGGKSRGAKQKRGKKQISRNRRNMYKSRYY